MILEELTLEESIKLIKPKPSKRFHGIIRLKGLEIRSREFAHKTKAETKKENYEYFKAAHNKWKKK